MVVAVLSDLTVKFVENVFELHWKRVGQRDVDGQHRSSLEKLFRCMSNSQYKLLVITYKQTAYLKVPFPWAAWQDSVHWGWPGKFLLKSSQLYGPPLKTSHFERLRFVRALTGFRIRRGKVFFIRTKKFLVRMPLLPEVWWGETFFTGLKMSIGRVNSLDAASFATSDARWARP